MINTIKILNIFFLLVNAQICFSSTTTKKHCFLNKKPFVVSTKSAGLFPALPAVIKKTHKKVTCNVPDLSAKKNRVIFIIEPDKFFLHEPLRKKSNLACTFHNLIKNQIELQDKISKLSDQVSKMEHSLLVSLDLLKNIHVLVECIYNRHQFHLVKSRPCKQNDLNLIHIPTK